MNKTVKNVAIIAASVGIRYLVFRNVVKLAAKYAQKQMQKPRATDEDISRANVLHMCIAAHSNLDFFNDRVRSYVAAQKCLTEFGVIVFRCADGTKVGFDLQATYRDAERDFNRLAETLNLEELTTATKILYPNVFPSNDAIVAIPN